jgi:hypothetical protein
MKWFALLTGFAALAGNALASNVVGSGLVVLHPSAEGALRQSGTSTIRVPAHAIYVNSNHQRAVTTQGAVTLDTPELRVVGNVSLSPNSNCTGAIICGGTGYTDPFCNMSFPNGSGMPNYGSVSLSGNQSQTVFLDPGFYNGISVTGNRTVNLRPGTYVIGSGGFRVTAGNITGYGVTLIMRDGAMDVSGASSFVLYPPTGGQYAYMVICQPAGNALQMNLTGGSTMEIQGGIYAPSATMRLTGNATNNVDGPLMGDLVVAGQVELVGTSVIRIGRANMQAVVLPKMPLFD